MRIASLSIRNIGNIRELDVTPGAVTVFEGKNGSGKTSALNAIGAALKAPTAELIRLGESKGEIVLILDDGMKIERTITEKGQDLKITDSDGFLIKAPQTRLNSLFNTTSVNPIEFLTASNSERIALLLGAVKLEFTPEQKERLAKMPLWNDGMLKRQPIEMLEGFKQKMYDERTGLNRELKSKTAHIQELSRTLPASMDPIDYETTIAEEESAVKDLETRRDASLEKLRNQSELQVQAQRDTAARKIAEIQEERDNAIAALRTDATEENNSIRSEYDSEFVRHKETLASIREREKSALSQRQVFETVEKQKKEADECKSNSEELTQNMDTLESMKLELCSKLPCGLSISDGEVVKDKITWEHLNTAKRVNTSIAFSAHCGGELKLIRCDGLECLDTDSFIEFEKQAKETNYQYFVTRVTDDPQLSVKCYDTGA